MAYAATLMAKVGLDTREFDRGVKRIQSPLGNLKSSALSMAKGVAVMGGSAAVVGMGVKKIFDLGAAVEETASKYATVFGPEVDRVNGFLDDFATKAGLSRQEAQDLTATTGAIAQGMGFAGSAAAGFAEEATRIAGDLASFNNVAGGTGAVLGNIQSAVAGERESLKKFGIVISQADLELRAMAQTGKKSADALTQQEKATATLALISERAGKAMGDLERTQGSAANTGRRVTARMKDLRDTLATALLPAIAEVLNSLDGMSGQFESMGEAVRANHAKISGWSKFTIKAVKFIGQSFSTLVRIVFNVGQAIGRIFQMAFTGIVGGASVLLNKVGSLLNKLLDGFNKLPGVNIDFRFGELDAETWFSRMEGAKDNLVGDIHDIGSAVGNLTDAYGEMLAASVAAWDAPVGDGKPVAGGGGGGGGGEDADVAVPDPGKQKTYLEMLAEERRILMSRVELNVEAAAAMSRLTEQQSGLNVMAADANRSYADRVELAQMAADFEELQADMAASTLDAQIRLMELGKARAADIQAVAEAEEKIRGMLEEQNLAAERRLELEEQLATIKSAKAGAESGPSSFEKFSDGAIESVVGSSKTLSTVMQGLSSGMGPLALVMPLIGRAMETLGPVIEKLLEPIMEVVDVIAKALAPMLKMLSPIIKLFADVLLMSLKPIVWVVSYLVQGIGWAVRAIGKAIDKIPFVSGKKIIEAGQGMIDAGSEMRDALKKTADAQDDAMNGLKNLPSGYKIAAARFGSMATKGGDAIGKMAGGAAGIVKRAESGFVSSAQRVAITLDTLNGTLLDVIRDRASQGAAATTAAGSRSAVPVPVTGAGTSVVYEINLSTNGRENPRQLVAAIRSEIERQGGLGGTSAFAGANR